MGSVRSGLSLGPFKTKNGSVPDAVVMVIKANERFLFLLEATRPSSTRTCAPLDYNVAPPPAAAVPADAFRARVYVRRSTRRQRTSSTCGRWLLTRGRRAPPLSGSWRTPGSRSQPRARRTRMESNSSTALATGSSGMTAVGTQPLLADSPPSRSPPPFTPAPRDAESACSRVVTLVVAV